MRRWLAAWPDPHTLPTAQPGSWSATEGPLLALVSSPTLAPSSSTQRRLQCM